MQGGASPRLLPVDAVHVLADAVPQRPDGTNEPRQHDYEEEDGEEEEVELGGIEESKQELFR